MIRLKTEREWQADSIYPSRVWKRTQPNGAKKNAHVLFKVKRRNAKLFTNVQKNTIPWITV